MEIDWLKIDWNEVYRRYREQKPEQIGKGMYATRLLQDFMQEVWDDQQKTFPMKTLDAS